MNLSVIEDAVRDLQARGERISVRAIHRVTGGSFRDVLARLRELLPGDELAADTMLPEAEDLQEPVLPLPWARLRFVGKNYNNGWVSLCHGDVVETSPAQAAAWLRDYRDWFAKEA